MGGLPLFFCVVGRALPALRGCLEEGVQVGRYVDFIWVVYVVLHCAGCAYKGDSVWSKMVAARVPFIALMCNFVFVWFNFYPLWVTVLGRRVDGEGV